MRRIHGIGQNTSKNIKPFRCLFLKQILSIIFFLSFSLLINGQEKNNWTLKNDYNGISVFTQTDEYHDDANGLHYEYIILKIQNQTPVSKKVTIEPVLYYDGKKYGSGDIAGIVIYMSPGETIQGDMGEKSPEQLRIFSRFLNYSDKPVLNGFDLKINTEDL